MLTVLGIDSDHKAHAVEIKATKEEAVRYFEGLGWTNLMFLED